MITATLAPGVYNPAQSVSATMEATSSSLDIGVTTPLLWIAQGASVSVPLTARVVSLGVPQSGKTVNFVIGQGSGSLSAPSAVTNSQGYASVTLTLTNFVSSVQVSACVAPANAPCQTISGNAVAAGLLQMNAVAGQGQVVAGTVFQPLTVRVTDSSSPPNPVLGASVLFQSAVMRPPGDGLSLTSGESAAGQTGTPVILSESQATVPSDVNGLASIVPSVGVFAGTLEIQVQVSAGTGAMLQDVLESLPAIAGGTAPPAAGAPKKPAPITPDNDPTGYSQSILHLPAGRLLMPMNVR